MMMIHFQTASLPVPLTTLMMMRTLSRHQRLQLATKYHLMSTNSQYRPAVTTMKMKMRTKMHMMMMMSLLPVAKAITHRRPTMMLMTMPMTMLMNPPAVLVIPAPALTMIAPSHPSQNPHLLSLCHQSNHPPVQTDRSTQFTMIHSNFVHKTRRPKLPLT